MNSANGQTKKRQRTIWISALSIVAVVLGLGAWLVDSQTGPSTPKTKEKTVRIQPPGTIDDRDAWRGQQAALGLDVQKQVQDLQAKVKRLETAGAKDPAEASDAVALRGELEKLKTELSLLRRKPPTDETNGTTTPLGGPASSLNTPIGQQPASNGPPLPPPPPPSRLEVSLAAPLASAAKANDTAAAKGGKGSKDEEEVEFIPAATFGRAYLMNGVYAPTGGQAQTNPQPVFFQLLEPLNLANDYSLDYRKCRITGVAWGNLASERADVRLEGLVCVIDGETIEVPLKGTVMDKGIPGLGGQIVDKSGRAIAMSAFAGIASGIGEAFNQSGMSTSISPLGATQIADPDKVVRLGVGKGVSRGMDRIVDVFLDAADKLFPVVEVSGGKLVEISITKSAKYKGRSNFHNDYRGLLQRAGHLE